MMRWQGTTMGIGLAPLAAPTARTAEGAPMELAMSRYEAVRPARDNTFNAGSYLYFERNVLAAMHAAGRRAASAWLAEGPKVDHLEEPAAGAAA